MRDINKVLQFRNDLSPFLIHLTRDNGGRLAKDNLENILREKKLKYGNDSISAATYGLEYSKATENDNQKKFFSAISFTETPLSEIHTLIDIDRTYDLRSYGLAFIKDNLKPIVSPVIYINNIRGDKTPVVRALCSLLDNDPNAAQQILPYVSVFGELFTPVTGNPPPPHYARDFTWEREWRYASYPDCFFEIKKEDVFIGLCEHDKIQEFEDEFGQEYGLDREGETYPLQFIDPTKNIKLYADKLIAARHRVDLKYSVV